MPLTQLSERAANRVANILDVFDRQIERYLVDGGTPPDPETLIGPLTTAVRQSMASGLLESDPTITDREIEAMITPTVDTIMSAVRASLRNATQLRARVELATPVEVEEDEGFTFTGLVRDHGPVIAFASLLALRRPRRRVDFQRLARNTAIRLPPRTSSYGRMRVRTDTAIVRNVRASQVVDARNRAEGNLGYQPGDWVLRVEDARLGPSDEPCEDVNGRLATPTWARSHPVEHPNCTRRTRPYRLRSGDTVTLLS